MNNVRLWGLGLAVAGAVGLWGCGGGGAGGYSAASPTAPTAAAPTTPTPTPTPTPAPTPTTSTVTIAIVGSLGNAAYQPNPVTAKAGDTVMFRNSDGTIHHIVMDDGSADLGDIRPGATSSGMTLRSAAASSFHCTIHASMVGSINGALPEAPPCMPDAYGYGC